LDPRAPMARVVGFGLYALLFVAAVILAVETF
jgi:hypothetical protein